MSGELTPPNAADAFVRLLGRQEFELKRLLAENRALGWRVTELSQAILNVVGIMEEWEPVFADVPEMKATFVRIRAALKMGDD